MAIQCNCEQENKFVNYKNEVGMALQKIDVRDLHMNPMTLISDEWMLITAGTQERGYNTMTACWGHMGAIWLIWEPTPGVRKIKFPK